MSNGDGSSGGWGWLATAGAITLLVVVVAFGLCAGFCGVNCLRGR
jgi:hypothetical protein